MQRNCATVKAPLSLIIAAVPRYAVFDYESMGAPLLASNDSCRESSEEDGNYNVDGNVALLHIPILR